MTIKLSFIILLLQYPIQTDLQNLNNISISPEHIKDASGMYMSESNNYTSVQGWDKI